MDADVISIGFDATFDELVDVHVRIADRSSVLRAWRRRSVITLGVVAGLGVLIAGWTALPPAWLVAWATVVGGAAAAVYRPWLRHCYARRMRRVVAEHVGGEKALHCDISVEGAGVRVSQGGTQTTYAWDAATLREDKAGDIELWFGLNLVLVRGRAFRGPEERARFVSRVHELAAR